MVLLLLCCLYCRYVVVVVGCSVCWRNPQWCCYCCVASIAVMWSLLLDVPFVGVILSGAAIVVLPVLPLCGRCCWMFRLLLVLLPVLPLCGRCCWMFRLLLVLLPVLPLCGRCCWMFRLLLVLLGRPLDLFPLLGCHSVHHFVHLLSSSLAM